MVHCKRIRTAYRQYAHDLGTRVDIDTFMIQLFRIPQFRVVLLFVVNIDILNTSKDLAKPLQDKNSRVRR